MESEIQEAMLKLKGFDGTRFAPWHGDLDLPYLYCLLARLSIDSKSATYVAFVKTRDKVWGSGRVTIEDWDRPLGNFDALAELFRPFVQMTDDLKFSWNAYAT